MFKNCCVNKNVLFKILILCALSCLFIGYTGDFFERRNVFLRHIDIVNRFYNRRKNLKTSKLGAVMYKNEEYPEIKHERRNKTFVVWKANHTENWDELKYCNVSNCIFTGNEDHFQTADAVIVKLQLGIIPHKGQHRDPNQIWMFLNDEAPPNAFSLAKRRVHLSELDNVFNWSLTYRSDADVPVPYGRTVALKTPIFPYSNPPIAELVPDWGNKERKVLVAILISNCGITYRMRLIQDLKKYIPVDVLGKCGSELRNSCPGHFKVDCNLISTYLFYLALENSKCIEYMTEKLFYNAYYKGAIPIIQGPSLEECEMFLAPNSYLHVDNYASTKELADDILRISKNEDELLSYHRWRNHFEVINEHGYFGVRPQRLCRVCEALNYNDYTKSVYSVERLRMFLDSNSTCRV